MGWYTSGPGGLSFKYGYVAQLARACGLGRLTVTPRIITPIEIDDLEFLGPLQRRIKELKLPWRPELAFSGPGRESLPVARDVDLMAQLALFAGQVQRHRKSVLKAIEKTVEDGDDVDELTVSMECDWSLPPGQLRRFVDWVNAPLEARQKKISMAGLRKGKLDARDWYRPPRVLAKTFAALERDDDRSLALRALAHAAVSGEPIRLGQPDDDYQVTVWTQEGGDQDYEKDLEEQLREANEPTPRVLVFRPADDPFVGVLANALGLPARMRKFPFYFHSDRFDDLYKLPPEPKIPKAHEATGYRFSERVVDMLFELPAFDNFDPPIDDEDRLVSYGWPNELSLAELSDSFIEAGFEVWTLGRLFEDTRKPQSGGARRRLAALLKAARPGSADARALAYVLKGSKPSPPSNFALVTSLFSVLDRIDLTRVETERLATLMRISEPPEDDE